MEYALSGNEFMNGDDRFNTSLRELRDLHFQLHRAADFYEKAFLKTAHKKIIIGNTKEYINRAIVTVVDHMGSVSANLNRLLSMTPYITNTQFRIDALKQRMTLSGQQIEQFLLSKVRLRTKFPVHYIQYISSDETKAPSIHEVNIRDICVSNASQYRSKMKESQITQMDDEKDDRHDSTVDFNVTSESWSISKRFDEHFLGGMDPSTLMPVYDAPSRRHESCNSSFRSESNVAERYHDTKKKKKKKKMGIRGKLLAVLWRYNRKFN